ncbi:MAG: hypothetical protein WBO55_06905, partial [Rhizobiaceae bacterium]
MPQMQRLLNIKSDNDAWEVLSSVLEPGSDVTSSQLSFESWPELRIYIEVDNHILRPTVMRAAVEFQESLWRGYALIKYGEANIAHLTDDEKAALELEFRVNGGSIELLSDAWKVLEPIIPEVAKKMDGRHVAICVVCVALLYFGADVWKAHLQARVDEKKAELTSETKFRELEAQRFTTGQETERMKILERAYDKVNLLRELREESDQSRLSILKGMPGKG